MQTKEKKILYLEEDIQQLNNKCSSLESNAKELECKVKRLETEKNNELILHNIEKEKLRKELHQMGESSEEQKVAEVEKYGATNYGTTTCNFRYAMTK